MRALRAEFTRLQTPEAFLIMPRVTKVDESSPGRRMEAFRRALKARGLSVTAPRLKIAEEVFASDQHLTAEDLYERLKDRNSGVGRVTVYRTLKLMVEAGLVEARDFGGQGRFEPVVGRRHHDHLVCTECKRVVEFESDAIEREQDRIARREGFELVHHVHTLFGRCEECRRIERRPQDAAR